MLEAEMLVSIFISQLPSIDGEALDFSRFRSLSL